jgi:uncharacterized protein
MHEAPAPQKNAKLNLNLDYRWITLALVTIIVAMAIIWRPWQSPKTADRTVEVTGEATVSAVPDEFVFYPTYEFRNADKDAALQDLTLKNNEVIAKVRALGVAEKDVKSNSDSWSFPVFNSDSDATPVYNLRLTFTVRSKDVAQKVQDYLITTGPEGSISPQATFSDKKRKQLEDSARDEASKDARAKAEKSAKNLGFKIAAVKKVSDGAGFGGGIPYFADKALATMEAPAEGRSSLTVQPGENDLSYTVTVTYFIK